MIRTILCVLATHFFSRGRFLEFSNSKIQSLIVNKVFY